MHTISIISPRWLFRMIIQAGLSPWRRIASSIAILVNNAFKTVQQSAKDKEDICRRVDARQRYLTQDFTL
jgi:hypothetical protein